MSAVKRVDYDEFGLFHENAEEFGIPYDGPPVVRRASAPLDDGRQLSALVWGEADPELVFLHGGAQNAHTWDTVALALDRPLVAIDLPGHGHSDGGRRGALGLRENAEDVAAAVRALAPRAKAVIGMSLGGVTTLALSQVEPDVVQAVVLIDVTPGANAEKAAPITAFINGPESFADFDEILARTIQFNPTRSVSSLRRGILHNAVQRDDGSWVWRYARFRAEEPPTGGRKEQEPPTGGRKEQETGGAAAHDFGSLWDAVSDLRVPLMLVRGMLPQSVVDDGDEAELLRRKPDARVEHVADAGHSVQGDQPLELARLIDDFVLR